MRTDLACFCTFVYECGMVSYRCSGDLKEFVQCSLDAAGQKIYQDHPIHRQFVADCEHLWEKVIVYDAIGA